jgi:hypothetical protein
MLFLTSIIQPWIVSGDPMTKILMQKAYSYHNEVVLLSSSSDPTLFISHATHEISKIPGLDLNKFVVTFLRRNIKTSNNSMFNILEILCGVLRQHNICNMAMIFQPSFGYNIPNWLNRIRFNAMTRTHSHTELHVSLTMINDLINAGNINAALLATIRLYRNVPYPGLHELMLLMSYNIIGDYIVYVVNGNKDKFVVDSESTGVNLLLSILMLTLEKGEILKPALIASLRVLHRAKRNTAMFEAMRDLLSLRLKK